MAIDSLRPIYVPVALLACLAALLCGCAGNGMGLDDNGNPIGSTSSAPGTVSADFQSIQDNIFTPICTKCHIGANAPEGLQLDAAHSYALLVGVPSAEVPTTLRVKAGDPTNSYLIQKLENANGIVGAQMPFGGPYLPQSTIDAIAQWITNGAAPAASGSSAGGSEVMAVTATTPVDRAQVDEPVASIAVGFSQRPDASYLNGAVHLQNISAAPETVPVMVGQAEANPATVLLTPLAPLGPGTYRITIHGGDNTALTSVAGEPLRADYSFTFTVGVP